MRICGCTEAWELCERYLMARGEDSTDYAVARNLERLGWTVMARRDGDGETEILVHEWNPTTEAEAEWTWAAHVVRHGIPDYIPANPDVVYAEEWPGWAKFISSVAS